MVITTAPNREIAEKLAEGILESRLAACVQMAEIRSFYIWEGVLHKEGEVALYIKTTEARYSKLEAYIEEYHPYDVPEIIKLPMQKILIANPKEKAVWYNAFGTLLYVLSMMVCAVGIRP